MGGVVVLRATNPSVSFMDGKEASWCRGGRVATNGPTNTQIKSPRAVDRPYERSGYRTSLARPHFLGSKASSFPHAPHPWGSEASHQRVSRYPPIAYKKRIWGLFQHRTGGSNGKVRAGPNWSESQTADTEQTVNSLNTTPIPLHYIYRGLQDLSRLCSAVLVSTKEH